MIIKIMEIDDKRINDKYLRVPKELTPFISCLGNVYRASVHVESSEGKEIGVSISVPHFLSDLTKSLLFFLEDIDSEVKTRNIFGFSMCNEIDDLSPIFLKDKDDFILAQSIIINIKSQLGRRTRRDGIGYFVSKNDDVFELIDLGELPRRRIFHRESVMNIYDLEAPYISHSLTLKKIEAYQKKYPDSTIYVRKPMKEMVVEFLICFAENIVDLKEYDWIWNSEYIQEALANYQKLKKLAGNKGWLEGIELRDFEIKSDSNNKE